MSFIISRLVDYINLDSDCVCENVHVYIIKITVYEALTSQHQLNNFSYTLKNCTLSLVLSRTENILQLGNENRNIN